MRSLPHIIIACGVVWAGSRFADRLRRPDSPKGKSTANSNGDTASLSRVSDESAFVASAIDYRLVSVGSLLPDLVDRALRRSRLGRSFKHADHLLGHTFLLNLAVLLPGLHLASRCNDPRLLSVGLASVSHLLVDPVIRAPKTLFWPLLGLEFPQVRGLGPLLTIATQAAAALVVLQAGRKLWQTGRLRQFLATGRL